MKKYLFCFCTLWIFLVPEIAFAQSDPDRFVALLRQDGVLVPFAVSENNTWRNTTKKDLDYLEHERPVFYLYDDSQYIEVLQLGDNAHPEWSGAGFETSYSRSTPHDESYYPAPNAGMALSWEGEVVSFIGRQRLEGDTLIYDRLIVNTFREEEQAFIDQGERHEVDGEAYSDGIPIRQSLRDSLQLRYSYAITEQPINGIRLGSYSASRSYFYGGCGVIAQVGGWFIEKDTGIEVIDSWFSTGDCDGKMLGSSASEYIAFASGGNVFVASELGYYEGQGYQLYQVHEDQVVALLEMW